MASPCSSTICTACTKDSEDVSISEARKKIEGRHEFDLKCYGFECGLNDHRLASFCLLNLTLPAHVYGSLWMSKSEVQVELEETE